MAEQTFPYTGWVLMPSFTQKAVVFVKPYGSSTFSGHISEGGKYYSTGSIYASREEAIAAGVKQLEALDARIKKMTATRDKRLRNLGGI